MARHDLDVGAASGSHRSTAFSGVRVTKSLHIASASSVPGGQSGATSYLPWLA